MNWNVIAEIKNGLTLYTQLIMNQHVEIRKIVQ